MNLILVVEGLVLFLPPNKPVKMLLVMVPSCEDIGDGDVYMTTTNVSAQVHAEFPFHRI